MHTLKVRTFYFLISSILVAAPNLAVADGSAGDGVAEAAALLVLVPSICLVIVAIPMLFKFRTFLALLFGLFFGGIFTVISLIASAVKPNSSWAFSIWMTLGFVIVAFLVAARDPDNIYVSTFKYFGDSNSNKDHGLGICPTCDAVIPLESFECPVCQASFGPGSPVKVKKVQKSPTDSKVK